LVAHIEGGTYAGVFEHRVLSRIFGLKRDTLTGEWRKIHSEELYDPYPSPHTNRLIKTRRMRWAGHVARMREKRGAYRALVENLRVRERHFKVPGVDWMIILKRIFRNWDGRGADLIGLAQNRDVWRTLVNAVMNLRVP
jgi:hypothetical protein